MLNDWYYHKLSEIGSTMRSTILSACSFVALVGCACLLSEAKLRAATQSGPEPPSRLELSSDDFNTLERQAQEYNHRFRLDLKLPKMFDFETYKRAFEKNYESALEEMLRLKLFLAQAFRVFVAAVEYKYRRLAYYLSLNRRSDWTREEYEACQMKPTIDKRRRKIIRINKRRGSSLANMPQNANSDDNNNNNDDAAAAAGESGPVDISMAEPEDIEAELERIEAHAGEPGYEQLADELARQRQAGSSDQSRDIYSSTLEELDRRLNFDVGQAFDRTATATATATQPDSATPTGERNPDYLRPSLLVELLGAGTESKIDGVRETFKISRQFGTADRFDYHTLPVKSNHWRNDLRGLTARFVKSICTKVSDKVYEKLDWPKPIRPWPSEPDKIWVDHRYCLLPVRDQRKCGSCYAFSGMASLEWAFCKQTGFRVKFSEQYVVSCGNQLDEHFYGCNGGQIALVSHFVNNFGLELERHYPYVAHNGTCGYPADVPTIRRGYMRPTIEAIYEFPSHSFEEHLAEAPIMVDVATGGDFQAYGGGVWDGKNCRNQLRHSMLIVGHGREDDEEYWLMRNSWGDDYGEKGHIRLNKNSNCFIGWGNRLVVESGSFEARGPGIKRQKRA